MTAHRGHARFLLAAGRLRSGGAALKADLLRAEWESVDAIKSDAEAPIARLYASLLREQQAYVLANLPTLFATKAKPQEIRIGALLLDVTTWLRGIEAEFGPALTRIVEEGFRTGGVRVGQRLTPVLTPRAEAVLTDTVRKIQGTTVTTQADVGRIVARGMAEGLSLEAVTRQLEEAFTTWTTTRSSAVAETSTLATFERGQLDGYQAAGVDARRWLAQRDGNVRPEHDDADGQEVGLDEPFTVGGEPLMHPGDPAGSAGNVIRCFPAGTRVQAETLRGAIRSWYEGQLVTIKTALGNELTGTPNHPILTRRGFVPLGELRKGDYVISSSGAERMAGGDLDIDDIPTPIEQVYDTLAVVGVRMGMAGVGVDLYGRSPEGKVDVVGTDSLLRDRLYPTLAEPPRKLGLALSNLGKSLLFAEGLQATEALPLGGRPVPGRMIGSLDEALPLGDAGGIHAELLCGATPPDRDALLIEATRNDCATEPVSFRQGLDGLAPPVKAHKFSYVHAVSLSPEWDAGLVQTAVDGLAFAPVGVCDGFDGLPAGVALDEILNLSVRDNFAGHVYTLVSGEGVYAAEGIIVRNCRCSTLPIVKAKSQGRGWRVERDARIKADYPALREAHGHAEAKARLAAREAVSEATVERALYRS